MELADRLYDAIPDSHGGRVIGTDIARELLEEYAASREGKIAFTQATGTVAHYYAKDRLWRELNKPGSGKRLHFTAGGVSAGKSTFLLPETIQEYDLTFDGTLRDTGWAKKMIQKALDDGWKVEVDYVQRPLDLAAKWLVHRTNKTGRWGPIWQLPENHRSAQNSILQIAKKFKNKPNFEISFWLNEGETPNAEMKKLSLAEIDRGGAYSYDENHGIGKGKAGSDRSTPAASDQGGRRAESEGSRRVKEAFRREVESGDYEEKILRLLAKGDLEFEQVVNDGYPFPLKNK